MKRGFTLLELVVVIIIIGIMATLGVIQYGAVIERARGAEARGILGFIRSQAVGYRLGNNNSLTGIAAGNLSMGTGNDQIPTACRASHFFSYSFTATEPTITMTATRCGTPGKPPGGVTTNTLTLTSTLDTGVDGWTSAAGY